MRNNRTVFVLMLAAFASVTMLTGCQTHEQKMEIARLQGIWEDSRDTGGL